ncbi:unnamed protein product [Parnassius apollo]|uniref:(apollo) hypothetical protein n=1 Tax=Parnassius apollo TaxID=110799 RepID=A0A8S3XK93_PARAO|nr:unnamed protein product [Parnassius apollo]
MTIPHGAEDLSARDEHVVAHVAEHGRLHEVAHVARALAARYQPRALPLAALDQAQHLGELLAVHLRASLGAALRCYLTPRSSLVLHRRRSPHALPHVHRTAPLGM